MSFWKKREEPKAMDEYERIFGPFKVLPITIPPPLMPYPSAPAVRSQIKEMLLACLQGGMSYAEAKEACKNEYEEDLLEAQKSDERMKVMYEHCYAAWKVYYKEKMNEKNSSA